MVGYIYKIENTITKQCYIGQTINIKQRKRKHFTTLANNTHDNPKLQASWNKYGADNFSFEFWEFDINSLDELDQLECDYIDKYDGLTLGFNLAPGGRKPPNGQKIKDEDIVTFLCIQDKLGNGYGKTCEEIFGWAHGTASNAKCRTNYAKAGIIFDHLSQEEKDQIANDFISSQHLKEKALKRQLNQGGCEIAYQLTTNDYNFAFAAQELGYGYTQVAIYLHIKPATVKDWFSGRTRNKERRQYNSLSQLEKSNIQKQVMDAHLEALGQDKLLSKKEEDIISFLCYDKYYPQQDMAIQRLFQWPEGTCYSIRVKTHYPITKAKVALLSESEQQIIADQLFRQL